MTYVVVMTLTYVPFFLLILLLFNFESHYWGQKENQAQGFSLALDKFRIRVNCLHFSIFCFIITI